MLSLYKPRSVTEHGASFSFARRFFVRFYVPESLLSLALAAPPLSLPLSPRNNQTLTLNRDLSFPLLHGVVRFFRQRPRRRPRRGHGGSAPGVHAHRCRPPRRPRRLRLRLRGREQRLRRPRPPPPPPGAVLGALRRGGGLGVAPLRQAPEHPPAVGFGRGGRFRNPTRHPEAVLSL